MKHLLPLRLCAILLLAAGYGWAGGHFIPGDAPILAYGFQFGMLLILFLLAAGFLTAAAGVVPHPRRIRRNFIGLTLYSILTLLINIANIARGVVQGGEYGSRNSVADLVPILLIISGDLLWLATALYHNRTAAVRN